jgi:hypothetical protein
MKAAGLVFEMACRQQPVLPGPIPAGRSRAM